MVTKLLTIYHRRFCGISKQFLDASRLVISAYIVASWFTFEWSHRLHFADDIHFTFISYTFLGNDRLHFQEELQLQE